MDRESGLSPDRRRRDSSTGPGRPDDIDVAIEIVVDDVHHCPGCRLLLRLAWRREDPLAVHLQLTPQPDHPALPRGRWVVLRETLQAGLTAPAGGGDVRLDPDEAAGRLLMALRRSGRPASVLVPRRIVEAFLYETEQIVATGSEQSAVALQVEIDRLMRS